MLSISFKKHNTPLYTKKNSRKILRKLGYLFYMKKTIRLTERDLTRIVKRVINENKLNEDWDDETWSLYNDGIYYGGKIKDIVHMAKKYDVVNIRLNRIGESPSYDTDELERASKADYTKFPIVAVDLGFNGVGVLDGNHRVFQAREDGETKLKGYLIPLEDIEIYEL